MPAILRRRAAKLTDKKAKLAVSSQERKSYVALVLSRRRDQRLRRQSDEQRADRRKTKKQYAEIRVARNKAFEKSKKKAAPVAAKAAAPKEKRAAPAAPKAAAPAVKAAAPKKK